MRIEKRGYSSRPWRLIDEEGRELCVPEAVEHPDMGRTLISQPVSGNTRSECEERALAFLEELIRATRSAT